MIILIHTSKTMRPPAATARRLTRPALLDQAEELASYLRTLSADQLAQIMAISPDLAERTRASYAEWTTVPDRQAPAVDSFTGDIYSGLRSADLSPAERDRAKTHLRILSGLYGILRPDDGIHPYRLELGYRLPDPRYASLYAYWGDRVAACLPERGPIVNLAAVEYSRVVTPYVDPARLVTPKFLTVDPKTGEPKFVVVHAKIARGAFARWLLTTGTVTTSGFDRFAELGYQFDVAASTPRQPVFVCAEFQGKGLSVRLRAR